MEDEKIIKQIEERLEQIRNVDSFVIDRERVIDIYERIRDLFFPDYYVTQDPESNFKALREDLESQISKIDVNYDQVVEKFLAKLPEVQDKIYKDVQALYDGDPSAKTYTEIITSFPGVMAVFLYRIGHVLYELDVPIIPRILTEYAHEKTGIDINPGAQIGEYFCIDHGTGIVIGETAVVGHHVRLYHGVTLGVRSFKKDEEGNLMKGGKRHPNIGNNVIIYANATVLGGDTYIEDNSVIPTGSLVMQTPEKYL